MEIKVDDDMIGEVVENDRLSAANEDLVNSSMQRSRRVASKMTDPTRDTGGFWKSIEGVQASQTLSKTFDESLTFGDDEGDEDEDDLQSWQLLTLTTIHGHDSWGGSVYA